MIVVCAIFVSACGEITPAKQVPRTSATQSPSDAPDVALITCKKDGSTKLKTPAVQAQPDGVHVKVTNRAGEPVSIYGLTLDSSEGIEEHVVQQPPGSARVGCAPYSMHGDSYDPVRTTLDIVDPDKLWVDIDLACPPGSDLVQSTVHDYFGDPSAGEEGDVVEIARRRVRGEREDDRVERAGYPDSYNATVRVVRDEYVIAELHFDRMEKGGWVLGSDESCASSGLRIR